MALDWIEQARQRSTESLKLAKQQLRAHFERTDDPLYLILLIYHIVHWLEVEPAIACGLLNRLTNGSPSLRPEDLPQLSISPWQTKDDEDPFVVIAAPRRLVHFDTLSRPELIVGQIARRRALLDQSGVPHTGLVLLTRYPVSLPEGVARPDVVVQWSQVVAWLSECQPTIEFSRDLIDSFGSYLRKNGVIP